MLGALLHMPQRFLGTCAAMRLEAPQPILTNDAMGKIRHIALFTDGAFKSYELDICYPAAWGADGLEAAIASGR